MKRHSSTALIILAGGCSMVSMTAASSVDVAVDENNNLNHMVDTLDLLLYTCLLILTIVTVWLFKQKRFRFLHESGLAVIYGLIVGLIVRLIWDKNTQDALELKSAIEVNSSDINYSEWDSLKSPPSVIVIAFPATALNFSGSGNGNGTVNATYVFDPTFNAALRSTKIREKATFDPEFFFNVLLPPIIFHAGYSMKQKSFFNNFGAITAFALAGTAISAVVIAGFAYASAKFTPVTVSFLDALYFGSIVSATDPVSVLCIFADLQVDPMLNGLVLGEALFNDAVAIVLVGCIEEYAAISFTNGQKLEGKALGYAALTFVNVVFGSVGLGSMVGFLTAVLTKFTRICDFPLLETSLFTLMSYTAYLLAEATGMSGIVSLLFCGICQAHYTYPNLSQESKVQTRKLFETLNFLAENFIFTYIGVSMFTSYNHKFEPAFILGAFAGIAVARAANVYPLSLLVNCGRRRKIPCNYQHMLWFSGLRGAMAFALAVKNTVSDAREMFFSTTCLIATITVIFVGGLTTPTLTLLKIPVGNQEEETEQLIREEAGDCETEASCISHRSWVAQAWSNFDVRYMKPALTKSTNPTLLETLPGCCMPVAKCFSSEEQIHYSSGSQEN